MWRSLRLLVGRLGPEVPRSSKLPGGSRPPTCSSAANAGNVESIFSGVETFFTACGAAPKIDRCIDMDDFNEAS